MSVCLCVRACVCVGYTYILLLKATNVMRTSKPLIYWISVCNWVSTQSKLLLICVCLDHNHLKLRFEFVFTFYLISLVYYCLRISDSFSLWLESISRQLWSSFSNKKYVKAITSLIKHLGQPSSASLRCYSAPDWAGTGDPKRCWVFVSLLNFPVRRAISMLQERSW